MTRYWRSGESGYRKGLVAIVDLIVSRRRGAAGLLAMAIVSVVTVAGRTVPQPKVGWLILVDDLHIQFTATGHLRALLEAMATDVIQKDDEFSLAVSNLSVEPLARITDRDRLSSFARDVSGMALAPTDVVRQTLMLGISDEVELREHMLLHVTSRLLENVSGEQGRRALIVVSSGWPSGPEGHVVHMLATRAKALAVPVVVIDPQQFVPRRAPHTPVDPDMAALMATTAASLRAVAERTGGLALLESRDLAEVVGRARNAVNH